MIGELRLGPEIGVKSSVTVLSLVDIPVLAFAPKPLRAKALAIAQ